ncbi:MAG: hypothetical protein J0I01_05900 [Stenotrophomonas nitritireducens]|uniref:SDH family Clp fold serine proteinase n=1 Tax=Stenotrophomonas nitritireducens TaxID=83617 RepID=UPI001ACB2642|nr:hypothetical protein [Stenotrophomonas nitritireducens]MBN8791745.1 hypothetical protein [Stenotrophomonas nitritireducens]MBN8795683.1 hypothetical protein [Stenotrophomonas nitritireducens]
MNQEIVGVLRSLRDEGPDRDYIVISSAITRDLHAQLSDLLKAHRANNRATVFLTTYGGDPDGGYRIARCLRHYYKDGLRVVVPSWCKSAGTLVAIAGSELAIGDRGELGPLDVQVFKGSELQERSSGLDITEALGFVGQHVRWGYHSMLKEARRMGLSTKLAADMAAHIGAAIAAPLLAQVDPLRLGELQRATRIAWDYGKRLDGYSQNLKDGALKSLIHEYPSHSFVIDRKEAANLFHRVYELTPAEQKFVDIAWDVVADQINQPPQMLDFSKIDPPSNEAPNSGENDEQPDDTAGTAQQAEQASETDGGAVPEPGHSGAGGEGVRVRSRRGRAQTRGGDRQQSHVSSSPIEPADGLLQLIGKR